MKIWCKSIVLSLLTTGSLLSVPALAQNNPLKTWNLLSPSWNSDHPLEFMTIEWEYYMIHDYEGKFNGVIGYVMTNPRNKGGFVGKVMPKGGNIAVGGQIHGAKAIGDYYNFGKEGTHFNLENRDTYLRDDAKGYWANLEGLNLESPTMHLTGKSERFAWDLMVSETEKDVMEMAYMGHDAFLPVTDDTNLGTLPDQTWTVDGVWPKTRVRGTLTLLATGEVIQVDGKGYRENSWGRYAMPLDGWDFLVFSEYEENGVIAIVQTYHHSTKLDYMDLSFHDNGELKNIRFQGATKALRWYHKAWQFNATAHQCVPMDWEIAAESPDYRVEIHADIDPLAQESFISNATIGTRIFFIHEQYPKIIGRIFRRSDNSLVKEFKGQAGGEFALHKSIFKEKTDESCVKMGESYSN